MAFSVGSRLRDRYVVVRVGESDRRLDRYVLQDEERGQARALTVYARLRDPSDVGRVIRAASLVARIDHPNILPVRDRWVDDGLPHVVTDLPNGATLQALLSQRGALPWPVAMDVTVGILSGLGALHAEDILYRNLQPRGVCVQGESPAHVTLAGLGMAKSLRGIDNPRKITQAGYFVGDADYISPEQLTGRFVDETADIYATALVLYEMLAGDLPEQRGSFVALAQRQRSAPPPPVAPSGQLAIPPALRALVVEALAPNPADRPATVQELARALHAVAQAFGVQVSPFRPPKASSEQPDQAQAAALAQATAMRVREEYRGGAGMAPPDGAADSGARQVHVVLAARLPEGVLERPEVELWLADRPGNGRLSVALGDRYWVAFLDDESAPVAEALAEEVRRALEGRFGDDVTVATAPVKDSFAVSEATLQARAPLPAEATAALARVLEV